MNERPAFLSGEPRSTRVLLLLLVPAALLLGLYARFKGIGTWPLGVDEFYISRSIDHVLASGVPAFPCGGYYTRGALFQYAVAGLRMGGLSAEFAGRFAAALSSLLVLPAAYALGKRAQGPLAGWLTLVILCVSIWEIEMARFGRMYAPFQAVFVFYLLFYLRYSVDRDAAALRWMAALSIVGVLTWEGGTLLGVANIFALLQWHERGRLSRAEWRRLGGLLVLLGLLYAASRDLRGPAGEPLALPSAPAVAGAAGTPPDGGAWLAALRLHYVWAMLFLAPLTLAAASTRFIWSFRSRWLACAGLALTLAAALAHAFTAVAGILALMLLIGLLDWPELIAPASRPLRRAVLALLLFWLAYDQLAGSRSLEALFGFPDVFQRIGRPWGRALPIAAAGIALCVAFWFTRSVAVPPRAPRAIRSLLAILFLMVLVIGAIPTERIETRYTFFLYPLLIVLAVAAILELAKHAASGKAVSGTLLVAAPLLCYAVTEDFQLAQAVHIDSAGNNFRVGMTPARADHYYPRNDMRGIAEWLAAHVRPGDVVISGIPNLDQYYHGFDYFYLDDQDNRYDAYVCADGRTERWTNHRVLYNLDSLGPAAAAGHHVYATVYPDVEARLQAEAGSLGLSALRVFTGRDGKTGVISIGARGAAAPAN